MSQFWHKTHLFPVLMIILLSGCATRLPASYYPRNATYALEDTSETHLGIAYAKAIRRHPRQSGFHILSTGPEALMMRIAMIEASQRSIDIQYFSTREDTTGKLILEAIIRAADRGVRVRMLLDNWELEDFEKDAVSLNTHPNIEIRVFNPYSTRDENVLAHIGNVFSDMDQFTRRMHNKAMIADNQISIMGGRNLGDEYFSASETFNFQDIDVFSTGPVTHQISNNFDAYWNSDEAFPVSVINLPSPDTDRIKELNDGMKQYWEQMTQSPTGQRLDKIPLPHAVKTGHVPLIWAPAELVADTPAKIDQPDEVVTSAPRDRILKMADGARHEFIIFSPYFVPLEGGVEWLTGMVDRGVAVRIITNSLSSTDMVPAQAGYGHYREALVKGGVDLYEIRSSQPQPSIRSMFKPSSQNGLHAKIYMVDQRELVIGSFNLDPRSIHLNTEQVLLIHSAALCNRINKLFQEVTTPSTSYHIVAATKIPGIDNLSVDQASIEAGPLVWVTEENGKTVHYNFNPHAGFWRTITNAFFSILPIDNEL